jgi:hypothetical protein
MMIANQVHQTLLQQLPVWQVLRDFRELDRAARVSESVRGIALNGTKLAEF